MLRKPHSAFIIQRYPSHPDKSLKAYSAADEIVYEEYQNRRKENHSPTIWHDTFGFLTTQVYDDHPVVVTIWSRQKESIQSNVENNGLDMHDIGWASPFDSTPYGAIHMMKVPKSLDLFDFYLSKITLFSPKKTIVLCGFMTRHFSEGLLAVAGKYFEKIHQTKAKKKARVLVLESLKKDAATPAMTMIDYTLPQIGKHISIYQYPGVFSSRHIDYGTQFLLSNFPQSKADKVLDIGCGNGIISLFVNHFLSPSEIHMMDDSILAIESAKLNITSPNVHFHHTHHLEDFASHYFDLVVTNPPFHFEHENDIHTTLSLLTRTKRLLSKKGTLIIVANRHLNYLSHLKNIYSIVDILKSNKKYIIYSCQR